MYLHMGQFDKAIEEASKALDLDPNLPARIVALESEFS
jgi:tetratricopeptide (TPR) repeat protein